MRVLITGAAGFAGSHLAEYLLSNRAAQDAGISSAPEIHAIIHRHHHRIQHLLDRLHVHRGDLRNALWVSETVEAIQPDVILHLAAWSDVGGSWQQPWTVYELNIQCQLNLLEAQRRWRPEARTVVVTSNEAYGLVDASDLPIDEETPFRPNSPYGVSKATQDMMALQYVQSHKLPIVRARSFNHMGPGQASDFAGSAFARQIAEIEAGLRPPVVRVGNLDAERDFTDVRDVVRAYWLLALRGESGCACNVGSGVPHSARWLLETLLAQTTAQVAVEPDPARMRPSDIPRSYCNNARLRAATGWQPEISLEQSLGDMLDYWRRTVRNENKEMN